MMNDPRRLYVSGPMTGYPDFNYPAFYQAAAMLEYVGYEVINPAESSAAGTSYPDLIRKDLHLLLEADGVAVLEGWWASRGAQLETTVAGTIGMPVRSVIEWIDRAEVIGEKEAS